VARLDRGRLNSSSIDNPVTRESFCSLRADGEESPFSQPQTVGWLTPMSCASAVCVRLESARYCLSRSMPSNIGESYTASIGQSYPVFRDTQEVHRRPKKRTVWERVKEALHDASLPATQAEAAKIAQVKQPSVSDWNKQEGYPEMANAVRLAERLNVCVDWILTGREPKKPGPPAEPLAQELWGLWAHLDEDTKRDLLGFARTKRLPAQPPPSPEADPQRTASRRRAGSSGTGT
jgi:hypothetical protein